MKTPRYKQTICRIARSVFPLIVLVLLSQRAGAQTNTFPSTGNAGVGTTTPGTPLEVRKDASGALGPVILLSNNSGGANAGGAIDFSIPGWSSPQARIQSLDNNDWSANLAFFTKIPGASTNSLAERLRITSAGNVGIGTATPIYRFTIDGSAQTPTNTSGSGLALGVDSSYKWIQSYDGQPLYINPVGNNVILNRDAGFVGIGTASPGGPIDVRDSSGRQLLWNMSGAGAGHTFLNANGGNVHVAANLYFNGTNWNRHNTGAAGGMWWAGSDGTLGVLQAAAGSNPVATFTWPLFINTSGYVGMGTNSPAYKLDVQNGAVNASGGLCIAGDCKTAWSQVGGGSSQWTTSGSNISYSSGNVGVGTTSPTEKLHVSGNAKVTGNLTIDGNIAAKYQDVAEWVPASEQLSAGTVVVLDSTKSNQVISSSQAYDTRVAGVISEQPGIALGESGDGKVLVATTGRVRVKVDASRAPIHIGDLLVTSDMAGIAMKSEAVNLGGVQLHRPGTLIGKALEPLDKGTGTILVLLSLQ